MTNLGTIHTSLGFAELPVTLALISVASTSPKATWAPRPPKPQAHPGPKPLAMHSQDIAVGWSGLMDPLSTLFFSVNPELEPTLVFFFKLFLISKVHGDICFLIKQIFQKKKFTIFI
jgi:hypothetical protein